MLPKVILASQSPRRAEILKALRVPFVVDHPSFDEETHPYNHNSAAFVSELAHGKAVSIAPKHPEAVVIAADTLVFQNGRCFSKPVDRNMAVEFITALAGKWHSVFTGVCVAYNGQVRELAEETRVLFNPLTPAQVNIYLDAIDWRDKAGGYALQNNGSLLVSKIDGCFYNVMGLPVNTLQKLFEHFGLSLWDYLGHNL